MEPKANDKLKQQSVFPRSHYACGAGRRGLQQRDKSGAEITELSSQLHMALNP